MLADWRSLILAPRLIRRVLRPAPFRRSNEGASVLVGLVEHDDVARQLNDFDPVATICHLFRLVEEPIDPALHSFGGHGDR